MRHRLGDISWWRVVVSSYGRGDIVVAPYLKHVITIPYLKRYVLILT
jgi:hypothetical protein